MTWLKNSISFTMIILKEENEALRNFRLLLAKQCGEAIKNAMGMLGIEMPERM